MKKSDKNKRQYHITVGKKQLGPYTFEELCTFLDNGKIKDTTYVQRKGIYRWEYIRELPEFDKRKDEELPEKFTQMIQQPVEVKAKDPNKIWIVYDNNEKKGPYSTREVIKLIESQKIRRTAPVWKKGLKKWTKVNKLQEFSEVCYPLRPKEFKEDCVSYSTDLERSELVEAGSHAKEKKLWVIVLLLLLAIVIAGYKFVGLAKTSLKQGLDIDGMMKSDSEVFRKKITK